MIWGSGEARWITNGPEPGIAKMTWLGMEVAGSEDDALGVVLALMIAWRSEPGPLSLVFVTRYGSCNCVWVLATFRENSEVSPVARFVAVALTRVPRATLPGSEARITAPPTVSVNTVAEPIGVAPCPWPELDADGFAKNWMR